MIWVDIPGWDRYEISEHGAVRSKNMVVGAKGDKTAVRKGRELALIEKANGYLCVTLTDGVRRVQVSIHRLVARAFLGECPIGLHVLHWDGNKRNNHFSNLRYGSAADNHDDERRLSREGRILNKSNVVEIRRKEASAPALADKFGVSVHTIHGVWYGRTWKHIQ